MFVPLGSLQGPMSVLFLIGGVSPRGPHRDKHSGHLSSGALLRLDRYKLRDSAASRAGAGRDGGRDDRDLGGASHVPSPGARLMVCSHDFGSHKFEFGV